MAAYESPRETATNFSSPKATPFHSLPFCIDPPPQHIGGHVGIVNSSISHWYERSAPLLAVAETLKVALPLSAVWFVGCCVIFIVGAVGLPAIIIFLPRTWDYVCVLGGKIGLGCRVARHGGVLAAVVTRR